MQFGYVAAKQFRLRWVDRANTKTIFAGEKLWIPVSVLSAPSYEAYRCADCGLVLMSYDPKESRKEGSSSQTNAAWAEYRAADLRR